jgi:hypothetical protein
MSLSDDIGMTPEMIEAVRVATLGLSKEDWARRGAPDAKSAGMASHVQECVLAAGTPPEIFLMQRDGLSRSQADAVVATCRPQKRGWRRLWAALMTAR